MVQSCLAQDAASAIAPNAHAEYADKLLANIENKENLTSLLPSSLTLKKKKLCFFLHQ